MPKRNSNQHAIRRLRRQRWRAAYCACVTAMSRFCHTRVRAGAVAMPRLHASAQEMYATQTGHATVRERRRYS